TESEHAAFDKQHPVGDVCGRFVDAHGVPLGAPTDQRVLAVTFSQLLRIPEVVGVAAGAEQAPGVVGVLRSGAIHTAVFDVELAREILARSGSAGDSWTDPARHRSARSSPARTGRTRSGPPRTGSRRCVAQALPDSRSTKRRLSWASTGIGCSSRWVSGAARRLEDSSQAPSDSTTWAGRSSSSRVLSPSFSRAAKMVATLVPGSTPALTGVVVKTSPWRTSRVEVGPSRA